MMYGEISKLNSTIKYCMENVEFYKKLLKKVIPSGGISSIEEFKEIPFTTKEDVQKHYPYGFLGASLEDVRIYNESSGTSGGDSNRSSRVASYSTENDINLDLKRRTAGDLKFEKKDVVFNALPYAFTSSGINFHLAAFNTGAMVIPADNGSRLSSFRKQIDVIRRLNPTIIITSYPYIYATLFKMLRIPVEELTNLRAIQLCGMATSREGKGKISKLFNNVPVFDTYGMSEFGAITSTCNCKQSHINDEFYIEIINPKTMECVENGVGGEIVITTINREGSPKIRYRTGDIGKIYTDECACGRKSPRIEILGRLKDLIEVGGKRFVLSDFENVFYRHDATTGMYKPEFLEDDKIKITIDVEAEDKEKTAQELKEMVLTDLNIEIDFECVGVGQSRRELLAQSEAGSVKSLQSIEGADRRNQEWLVTY